MHLIDSDESVRFFLRRFAEDIEKSPAEEKFVAVDTEFVGENAEIPLLCLIQISTARSNFVIDPLSADISFLSGVFEDESLPKVFHSAAQDVEILHNLDIFVKKIYDTQLYEMILSTQEQISYQSITLKYTSRELDKSYSLSDWTARPLSKKQLKYAVDDAVYLREIYKKQKRELARLGRLDWLAPEMKLLEQEGESSCDSSSMIFQQLLRWAEDRAKEKNVSVKNIISERCIKRACKKGKLYIDKMLKYRGLMSNEDLRDFLIFARGIVPEKAPELPKRDPIISALRLILEICSMKNIVAPAIVANTADLETLACNFKNPDGLADIKCMRGWRKNIFGKYAMDFLNGKISIALNCGQLEFNK